MADVMETVRWFYYSKYKQAVANIYQTMLWEGSWRYQTELDAGKGRVLMSR
jgi:hypothetical protein